MSWLADSAPFTTYTLSQSLTPAIFSEQSFFEELPVIAWILNAEGVAVRVNQAWRNLAGANAEQIRFQSWWHWVQLDRRSDAEHRWRQFIQNESAQKSVSQIASQSTLQFDCPLINQHGVGVWHQVHIAPYHSPSSQTTVYSPLNSTEAPKSHCNSNRPNHWIVLCVDIQTRHSYQTELERKVHESQEMLNVSLDCVKLIDLDGNLIAMNRSGCTALGLPPEQVPGTKWMNLLPPSVHPRGRRALADARQGKHARFSGMSIDEKGAVCHWDNLITPLKDEHGKTASILCVSREISRQRAAEDRLRAASEQDPLTGLLNRKALRTKMKRMMASAKQSGESLVFLLIDLDHFKPVNDSYGHPAGDHLLRVISKRLKRAFQTIAPKGTDRTEQGYVARLGGDEFGVVFQVAESDREILLKSLQKKFSSIAAPVWHAHKQINGGLSAGGAMYPQDAQEISEWMRLADVALTQVKSSAKGTIRLFDAESVDSQFYSMSQARMVQTLLAKELFEVQYTKYFELTNNKQIVSYSAELCLPQQYLDMLGGNPKELLHSEGPMANEAASLLRKRVFHDLQSLIKETGKLPATVAMKTPIGDLMHQEFASKFLGDLRDKGLPTEAVELEVAESVFHSRSAELSIRTLKTLQAQGVRIVLTNYGMGLVSLVDLGVYPIDKIRLGPAFLKRLLNDLSATAVAKVICQLGIGFGLQVDAEGVDSREQFEILRQAGCTAGSGAYLENIL